MTLAPENGSPSRHGKDSEACHSATGRLATLGLGLALAAFVFSSAAAAASHYVYVVDTSKSMSEYRAPLLDRVNLDMSYALWAESRLYREGDQIHLWSFNLAVQDHLALDFRPDSEQSFRARTSAALSRMKTTGGTSLYGPVAKALEQFKDENSGDLTLVLYTDGKVTLSKREADYLVAMFKQYYEPSSRLKNFVLVRFGNKTIRPEAAAAITALNGRIIASGEALDLRLNKPSSATSAPPPETKTVSTVSVAPATIRLTNSLAPEITKVVPLELTVEPPNSALLVQLGLVTLNLPEGFTLTAAPDRLATEGKQAVTFVIRGAQAGHYSAKLNLSGPARIEPATIPVELEILPTLPDRIRFQFFSEGATNYEFSANGQWQRIPNVGLSLFYPDPLQEMVVRFEAQVPSGVELQALAGANPARPVEFGKNVQLAALGRIVGFQTRAAAPEVIGTNLTGRIAIRLLSGQNALVEGTDTLEIPFRFVTAGEVQIETSEIALGQVPRGTKRVKGILGLLAKGEAAGKKLRVVKHGQGLAGISITPTEIILRAGAMAVDLEFKGFEDRSPGPIDGAFTLVPEERGGVDLRGGLVVVRGTIPGGGSVNAEIENPMVVGQPFFIRARLDPQTNRPIHAVVRVPDSTKDIEVVLSDSGLAEDGDAKANDGVYSGMFKRTEALGTYQVWFVREGGKEPASIAPLNVPYFFKTQTDPLSGRLTVRKPGEYVQLKSKIISDYPGSIPVHAELAESGSALSSYVATKSLVAGENMIDLLVGLAPETQPGEYKFKVFLVTDKIGDSKAKIPVTFDITASSFFRYFVKLVAITLGIAGLILLAVMAPWKRVGFLAGSRKSPAAGGSADEGDQTFA